ncbi:hypothetical protein JW911_03390 [Candidatus Peregrinibacteria bacterium]|nr:hypothetical protein [Candidatus Peregrinibacteria bacterium]
MNQKPNQNQGRINELLKRYNELLAQKHALEAQCDNIEKELFAGLTGAAKDVFKIPEIPDEKAKN